MTPSNGPGSASCLRNVAEATADRPQVIRALSANVDAPGTFEVVAFGFPSATDSTRAKFTLNNSGALQGVLHSGNATADVRLDRVGDRWIGTATVDQFLKKRTERLVFEPANSVEVCRNR